MEAQARSEVLETLSDTRITSDPEVRAFHEMVARGRSATEVTAGLRKQLEARRHHNTWDRLPQMGAPTLVAAGRFDGIAALANSELLANQIPNAELQVFEGGHLFLFQDRRAFPAISEFLRRS